MVDISEDYSDHLPMHKHAHLVESLGDGTKVAEAIKAMSPEPPDRQAVYKWKRNGVPWKWRPFIAALAAERGVDLPEGFFPNPGDSL